MPRISKGAVVGAIFFGLLATGYVFNSWIYCQSQFGCSVPIWSLVAIVFGSAAVGAPIGWVAARGARKVYELLRVD
ncbi:MAG: hypothetical protein ACOC5K_02840 [Chloroflexota bacterium]